MARTVTQIYDALALVKSDQTELQALVPDIDNAQTLLADLNTPSRVGRWRLMLWTVAVCQWALEKLWDLFRAEVTELAKGSIIGTLRWYVEKARAFQYGHALEIINNVPGYSLDDPPARIVARAAGKENGSIVLLKVAKVSGASLVPLTGPELDAFEAYLSDIKMAGTVINVVSADSDLLKVAMTVYYNPLVLAADGTLILDPGIRPVDDAIRSYLANLPFNGFVVLTSLVDAVQSAAGVVNPVLGVVQAKYGAFPYANVVVQYETHAGHIIVDPANDLPTTITYLPHVV